MYAAIVFLVFFCNYTPTTEIYTLSLHDALPISVADPAPGGAADVELRRQRAGAGGDRDRKSTRLNCSHLVSSYAVFCWKKKNINRGRAAGTRRTLRLNRLGRGAGAAGRCGRRPRCFFFNDTATTEIYTLSLHDALPI